ncbi:MAG TPA: SDR family NAD(P)-dependent oxidoreductase [Candidatus Binataceae bacterium]|nr:SDR family NAD(P)-dependent oxidoreductase [Candidatus Binataceae bacterium]
MKNVVVTGGSRGLGLAISRKLASEGYGVIAISRRESDTFKEMAKQVEANGKGVFHFVAFDLEQNSAIPDLVKSCRKKFGQIYGLVNNAGIGTSGLLATMHNAQIQRLVQLNTIAPIVLSKYIVRSMMVDGGGRIVNVASITGFTGYKGLSVYSATKASLIGFTRSLAREVGPLGINVNAVAPGFMETDMTESLDDRLRAQIKRRSALQRLADADDVAEAVGFLLSAKSKNITGTVLTVDAGNTA